jgi:HD-like signal output (HDOD) protein
MNIRTDRSTREREAPTLRSVADLTERIGNLFSSPSYQPPWLPSVAIELLDVALYPDIDLKRISRLIARDPMLAGHVMRRVQSPFYAGRVPITDLNQAIFRLGLINIRDIVLEAALNMRVFTTPSYVHAMERVRRHSVATAHVAKLLAKPTGGDPHALFLLGLLHDIGIAAGLIAIDEMFEQAERPPVNHIWSAIETIHESAGTLLARIWDLPGDLPTAIGGHHHFQTGGPTNSAVATLHIAEAIATRLGRGVTPPGRPDFFQSSVDICPPEVVTAARIHLGLESSDIAHVIRAAEERLDAIR